LVGGGEEHEHDQHVGGIGPAARSSVGPVARRTSTAASSSVPAFAVAALVVVVVVVAAVLAGAVVIGGQEAEPLQAGGDSQHLIASVFTRSDSTSSASSRDTTGLNWNGTSRHSASLVSAMAVCAMDVLVAGGWTARTDWLPPCWWRP
jgi:hypothetical protein